MRGFLFVLFALCAAGPARAQVDSLTLGSGGGTYATDCTNASSPRVLLSENSILVIEGDKRVASKNANATFTWYAESPPANYLMTFFGDMADGGQMVVDVYQANGETWAKVIGDESVQKSIGKPGHKYLRCGPLQFTLPKNMPKTGGPGLQGVGAPALPGAAEYAMDPGFAALYKKALGKYGGEAWLRTLEGPGPETKKVTIAGTEYVVLAACKDHDCAENNTTLLWNAAKKAVYGKVRVAGKSALIGNPPKEVQKDLGDLWWKQWGAKE